MNERKVVYLDDAIEEVCDCVCGELKNRCAVKTGKSKMPCSFYDSLCALPSAQPETCAYWDGESNICALHRPSAQPRTEEEIQKIQDIEQAEIEKAFELGRQDAMSVIVTCNDCKYSHMAYDGK